MGRSGTDALSVEVTFHEASGRKGSKPTIFQALLQVLIACNLEWLPRLITPERDSALVNEKCVKWMMDACGTVIREFYRFA